LFSYHMQRRFGTGFLVAFLFIGSAYAAHLLFGLNEYVTLVSAGSLLFALIWYALGKKAKAEKQVKFGWKEFFTALMLGTINWLSIVTTVVTEVVLTGFAAKTRIGPILSSMILDLAHNQLFLVLLFTMIDCIIMGIGLSTTATYIVLAAVMAPALIKIGVPVL